MSAEPYTMWRCAWLEGANHMEIRRDFDTEDEALRQQTWLSRAIPGRGPIEAHVYEIRVYPNEEDVA